MKIGRRIRRKFGISAPRVAVRTHIAWYWRWLFVSIVVAFGILLASWLFDRLGAIAGWQRAGTLARLVQLEKESIELRGQSEKLKESLVLAKREEQIAAAAQAGLTQSVKSLQAENAKLKEDLAFLQSLTSGGRPAGISVGRATVAAALLPGEYNFQIWLVQSGARADYFKGRLQLVVKTLQAGRLAEVVLPADAADESYRVNVRIYQRLEGVFKLDPAAKVESVQVRVFQDGAASPRVVQSVRTS